MRSFLIAFLLLGGISQAVAQQPAGDAPAVPAPPPDGETVEVPSKPILVVDRAGHSAGVSSFAFAEDGQKLFTLSEDNTIQVWDVVTHENLRTLRLPWHQFRKGPKAPQAPQDAPTGRVHAGSRMVVAPDGKTVAVTLSKTGFTNDYHLTLIHVETGRMLAVHRLGKDGPKQTSAKVSFSRDGDVLAVGSGHAVRVWRDLNKVWRAEAPVLTLWKEFPVSPGSPGSLTAVKVAPDGNRLAASTHIAKKVVAPIYIWNLMAPNTPPLTFRPKFGAKLNASVGASSLAWSPEGSRLAATVSGKGSGARVMIWTAGGAPVGATAVNTIAHVGRPLFRSEHKVLLLGSSSVSRFNLKTKTLEEILRLPVAQDEDTVKLSQDFKRIAIRNGATIALLDLEPGAKPQTLSTGEAPPSFAFSKKGYQLAWTAAHGAKLIAGLDLRTAQPLAADELKAEDFEAPAHKAFSAAKPQGKKLASKYEAVQPTSRGGLIEIIATKQKSLVFTVYAAGQDWVVCTPEGYYAATPGGEQRVGWHVNNGLHKLASFYPFGRFRKKLYRPDVIAEVLKQGSVAEALKVANALRGQEAGDIQFENLLPPRCQLEVLEHDTGKVKVRVQAEAQVKGQPILGLRLYVDGRPFVPGGQRGLKRVDTNQTSAEFAEGKDKVDLTWTFTLPGEKAAGAYQLAVLARSRDAAAASNPIAVSFVNPAKVPNLYVLTAGINQYNDKALTLNFAVKDATEMAAAFAAHARQGLFAEVHTQVLADKEARRQAFLDHILEVRKKVKANDLFVVYFAGHGVKEKEDFYLLTVEAKVNALAKSALSGTDLRQALSEFPCQVLLMLDACHSAGFGEKGTLREKKLAPATDDATRAMREDEVGVAVLCAAMGRETALEKDGNGLFTRAVLDALRRADGVPFNRVNHLLYTSHLHTFVLDQVSQQSGERQHPFLSLPWVVQPFPVAKFAAK